MNWIMNGDAGDATYRDYTLYLPDVNKHGGQLRLSFDLEGGYAYMSIVLDDEDGQRFIDGATMSDIPLAWANAIASGVDGYTMASPAPVRRCACGYELRDYADTETKCGACAAEEN